MIPNTKKSRSNISLSLSDVGDWNANIQLFNSYQLRGSLHVSVDEEVWENFSLVEIRNRDKDSALDFKDYKYGGYIQPLYFEDTAEEVVEEFEEYEREEPIYPILTEFNDPNVEHEVEIEIDDDEIEIDVDRDNVYEHEVEIELDPSEDDGVEIENNPEDRFTVIEEETPEFITVSDDGEDFEIPVGYECQSLTHPWIDIDFSNLDTSQGLHVYDVIFVDNITGDLLYQSFAYRIQSDKESKPYIYIKRKPTDKITVTVDDYVESNGDSFTNVTITDTSVSQDRPINTDSSNVLVVPVGQSEHTYTQTQQTPVFEHEVIIHEPDCCDCVNDLPTIEEPIIDVGVIGEESTDEISDN